ncbi:glycosyltransferase [Gracilibacillus sp. YIM 98692]|uniref:MGDG synthase family glycosyltransferase n=1 Tax=Gracilibacillus sp. YIM 98692 TaxID=2663532 RepID=UPI0013D2887C|nr:glycosyltransferase [Gracilibacillus sp. YIM 98692]
MTRVLFMPLLQIPSGHHHAADCIQQQLKQDAQHFDCEKVEILSHCYGSFESIISNLYLYAIHKTPHIYSWLYKTSAVQGTHNKSYFLYEKLFLNKVLRILNQKEPSIVFCTHALPSYLLNQLKAKQLWSGLVVNVYTDYFINDLWGIKHIDYHFVPSVHVKKKLIHEGINANKILVTGIPVHPVFTEATPSLKKKQSYKVLISGGNLGAGSIEKFLRRLNLDGAIHYYVLCGKNKQLYDRIQRVHHPLIQAVPYIDAKEKMNELYDQCDAIVTKPGGVTITECLWKRLPIFVYEALPGQEEYNLHYLDREALVIPLDWQESTGNLEEIILKQLKKHKHDIAKRAAGFHQDIESRDIPYLVKQILSASS